MNQSLKVRRRPKLNLVSRLEQVVQVVQKFDFGEFDF